MSVAATDLAAEKKLRPFYLKTPGSVQHGGNASRRQLPELPITCGNGLINVKVCIKSVKAVSDDVGQAVDKRLGDSLSSHTWAGDL